MSALDLTPLENLANLDFDTFKVLDGMFMNRASAYYTALGLQGEAAGLDNVVNYASLARDVVNDVGVNGTFANDFTTLAAQQHGVDFSSETSEGRENRLRMQYELMREDLRLRQDNIDTNGTGEIPFSDIDEAHKNALSEIGLPPEAFSLHTPLTMLAENDPQAAQSMFENVLPERGLIDVLVDSLALGLGAHIDADQAILDIIIDYGKQAEWLNIGMEVIQDSMEGGSNPDGIARIRGLIETIQQTILNPMSALDDLADLIRSTREIFNTSGTAQEQGAKDAVNSGSSAWDALMDAINAKANQVKSMIDDWVDDVFGSSENENISKAGDDLKSDIEEAIENLVEQLVQRGVDAYNSARAAGKTPNDSMSDAVNEMDNNVPSDGDYLGNAAKSFLDSLNKLFSDYAWAAKNPDAVLGEIQDWLADVLNAFGASIANGSPLVLDLDADGIELVSLENTSVRWDIDNDGFAEATGWVAADDGLLAIDLNNDGVITAHEELFGNLSTDGFTDLSNLDTNNDNLITAADEQFSDLLVWQDINQNGVSETTELYTLAALHIVSINLNATTPSNLSIEGNEISHVSTYTVDDGINPPHQLAIVDAWFNYDNTNTHYDGDYTLDLAALFVPTMRGYGELPAMYIAASIDNDTTDPDSLMSLLQDFAAKDFGDVFTDDYAIFEDVTAIMYRWAGVDGIDPNSRNSRGGGIDARKIEFLEKLLGQEYLQQNVHSDPGSLAGDALEKTFETALYPIAARLIAQAAGASLFNAGTYYNPVTDMFEGFTAFNQDTLDALLDLSLDGHAVSDKTAFWIGVVNVINNSVGVSALPAPALAALQAAILASDATLSVQILLDEITQDINEIYGGSTGENWNGTNGNDVHTGYIGDDGIYGGYGNDTLYGGVGNDTITGGAGNDILNGQLGNDSLQGDSGADTYKYDLGQGNDTILEGGYDLDTLEFGAGITLADLTIVRSSNTALKITIDPDVGSGSVTITGNVEYLKFSDLSTFDLRTMNQTLIGTAGNDILGGLLAGTIGTGIDTIYGMDGNDTITANAPNENDYKNNYLYGGNGNDILQGSFGADYMDGGAGNDTLKGGGAGDDTYSYKYGEGDDIFEEYGGGTDKIVFGEGITGAMLNIYRINNTDVKIDINNGLGGSITIKNQTYNASYVIETQEFADSSTVGFSTISMSLHGTSANDNLYGTNVGASGLDFIYGHDGNDTITGYYSTSDTNFNYLYGGNGNDTINGASGIDTLQGDAGNDVINGGSGNDIYKFNYGDGDDTYSDSSGAEKIVFGEGITQSMLNIYRTSNVDAKIQIDGGAGGSIVLKNQNSNMGVQIETLEFYDGSTLQVSSLNMTLYGTSAGESLVGANYGASGVDTIYGYDGNDTLYGTYYLSDSLTNTLYGGNGDDILNGANGLDYLYGESGNDTLNGNSGNDVLNGGGGNDTLYGDGNDTYYEASGTDKIIFGAGITQAMLNIYRSSAVDVKIEIDGGAGGSIVLKSQTSNAAYSIETLEFSDGSTLHFSAIDLTRNGTSAADNLQGTNVGSSGVDTLYGHDGNDSITGYDTSSDTKTNYLYGGNGNDIINGASGIDYIYGDADNDTLKGADGNDFLYGGSGVDYLEGNNGNDTLYGGLGADTLKGSAGVDRFVFLSMSEAGDTIQDYNYGAGEKLDIAALLSEYDPLSELITDFVQITQSGANSILAVDVDGGANNFVQLATLTSTSGLTDEQALVNSGHLLIAA